MKIWVDKWWWDYTEERPTEEYQLFMSLGLLGNVQYVRDLIVLARSKRKIKLRQPLSCCKIFTINPMVFHTDLFRTFQKSNKIYPPDQVNWLAEMFASELNVDELQIHGIRSNNVEVPKGIRNCKHDIICFDTEMNEDLISRGEESQKRRDEINERKRLEKLNTCVVL